MKYKNWLRMYFNVISVVLIICIFMLPVYAIENINYIPILNVGIIESINFEFFYQSALIVILVLVLVCLVMIYIVLQTRKKIINNQIELQSAELINKSKDIYFSHISHEIRTPMNAIIGITSSALENVHDPERMEDSLNDIQISSKYLLALMNDVLDLSKIENNSMTLRIEATSLKLLLSEIKTIMEPQMKAKSLRFIINTDSFMSDYYLLDHVRLQQIIVNILSNSVKFTNNHGVIVLSLKNKGYEKNKQKIEFVIRDSGIGISQEFIPKLFLPFAQESESSGICGTGLGMVIVKKIVDLMGGDIKVSSKKGMGSKFEINLEVIQATSDEIAKSQIVVTQLAINGEGRKILLVEDNELNIKVAKRILENKNFVVELAKNGAEAVNIFTDSKSKEFSAILMDIQMPVMDGLKATEIIRNSTHEDAKKIPIIAMSANAFEEDRAKSIAAGMDEHLTKPIEPTLLYRVLNSHINK